ncbi:MAG: Thiamine-binding periplasmic protein [Alphaproteobacteria bacterium MarineAlpha5_Bin12]|nr:MAG: Thiamine-binding periplasmic protein [Alphaproteobacteria bacterium MarineAlpha5_Bin12]
MRIITIISFILFLFNLSAKANTQDTLTIYTYDSFVSEWGPGPIIKERFEKKFNKNLEFITVDSAATLLTKIILEGSSTKADIILGLDMNLIDQANRSNLFLEHSFNDLDKKINLPIEWESQKFIPYNYGYFAFVYNNKKFKNPPKSMNELINNTKARIVIQDPRTSTPGLGLLTWIKAIYGNEAENKWKKLNKKIITVTKGWTDSYYNIFLTGEADMVLSYTTSPAAHIMFENNYDYSAINFVEGNYISIEYAGILKSSKNIFLAKKFLNFMISNDFQSIIPSTNIMYPVNNMNNLPKAYENIEIPKAIQLNPTIINENKSHWIEEWLNASIN